MTVIVQRQPHAAEPGDERAWRAVSGWLAPTTEFRDRLLDPEEAYRYRLKAMSPSRVMATSEPVEAPA